MKLSKVADRVYHVAFANRRDMCRTLVRFSEFYENPVFRGRYFTLPEFKSWYKKHTGQKRFGYASDWDGFNLSGKAVLAFRRVNFIPYSEEEIAFLRCLEKVGDMTLSRSYVICTARNSDPETLQHEMAHALYAVDLRYRSFARGVVERCPQKKRIFQMLRHLGYHPKFFVDEAQAYLVSSRRYVEKCCTVPPGTLVGESDRLNKRFDSAWAVVREGRRA